MQVQYAKFAYLMSQKYATFKEMNSLNDAFETLGREVCYNYIMFML